MESVHRQLAKTIPGLVIILLAFVFIVSCQQQQLADNTAPEMAATNEIVPSTSPTITPTFTNTPRPTASQTPSVTPTATPSPTPTATAVAINIVGNPRAARLQPTPQGGGLCGVVDILDFPIDPPDAASVSRAGGDFGTFRQRYDKFHAGEDWGGPAGRENFGTPVYNIGHGIVMYAAPDGWGRDKGVVIIQHTLPDRSTILSFYGHLDPPSVTLTVGDCIRRGEQVGNIGRPRSSPHLHFEIRNHMPYQPGPGYWPEDPTTAGWLPPSQTIWENRMTYAPGVVWSRPLASNIKPIGQMAEDSFIVLQDGQLLAMAVDDGRVLQQFTDAEETEIAEALLMGEQERLITATRGGQVTAYALPEFTLVWQTDEISMGIPSLLPLGDGGVLAAVGAKLFALNADGELLWQEELPSRPLAWAETDRHLILTTSGSEGGTYLVAETGVVPFLTQLSGKVTGGTRPFLYNETGIYQLDLEAKSAELVYALPSASRLGNMLALPDGGVLVAHADARDHRLLALNADGSLRWQRSIAAELASVPQLLMLADRRLYLLAEERQGATLAVPLFELDMDTAVLTHLFDGGTVSGGFNDSWVSGLANGLLLNVGGGQLLMFDPQTAVESLVQISNP